MADTPVATPEQVAEHRKELAAEYGTYVAVQPIDFNGVRAFNAGDSVPISTVERYGYASEGVVAKIGTKAATQVIGALHASALATGEVVSQPVSLAVPVDGR
jgi:hypothetical protein